MTLIGAHHGVGQTLLSRMRKTANLTNSSTTGSFCILVCLFSCGMFVCVCVEDVFRFN